MIATLRRVPRAAWYILAGAFVIRLGFVLGTIPYEVVDDDIIYDRVAISLADFDGYPEAWLVGGGGPSAFTPPGYPVFLAVIYGLTGDSQTVARAAQALLGTGVVAMTGVLAWQLWGRREALVAMAIACVLPFLFLQELALLSEPLFTLAMLAAVAAVLRYRRSSDELRWVVIAGALVGVATLTRPNGFLILLPLAFAAWRIRIAWPGSLRAPAAMVMTCLAVMTPWVVRNAIEFDAFVPFSTREGMALARNYNHFAHHADPPSIPHRPPIELRALRGLLRSDITELEANRLVRDRAFEYIREHPDYAAATVVRNTARALHVADGEVTRSHLQRLSSTASGFAWAAFYAFLGVLALAVVGIGAGGLRSSRFVWVVPVLLLASVVWMAGGRPRYIYPVEPFVILLAAYALTAIAAWRAGRRRLES